MIAVHSKGLPQAGLLSHSMVLDLAKLGKNLTKPNIQNTSNSILSQGQYGFMSDSVEKDSRSRKCISDIAGGGLRCFSDILNGGSKKGLSGLTSRGCEDLFGVITREKIEFLESQKVVWIEFSESIKKGLLRSCYPYYSQPALAKSSARIGVLVKYKATHDAPSVFFCVLAFVHPFFSATVIIRAARKIMVGWMGAEKSAPVTLYAGYANPVQLTTSEIGVSGGGIKSQYKEAAIMATTLTQTTPKFEFRFLALQRADMQVKPCRISVQASSEKEARRILAPNFFLSLAARLPVITSDNHHVSLSDSVTISTIKSDLTCPKWIHLLHFAHPASTKAAPRMAGNSYLKVKHGGY